MCHWLKTHRFYALSWAFVALLLVNVAFATSVVALLDRRHHRIVIAADSLVRHQYAGTTSQKCKTIVLPECVCAIAGMFDKPYPPFHLEALAREACNHPGDLRNRADAFLGIAKSPVVTLVQYLHDKEPQYYASKVASGQEDFIDVLFAGTQGGYLSIFARGFRVDTRGVIRNISDEIIDNGPGEKITFFAGANEAILSYIATHKRWERIGYISAARKFVRSEIDANRREVGPPISILQIDWFGRIQWINTGVCTENPRPKIKQARPTKKQQP